MATLPETTSYGKNRRGLLILRHQCKDVARLGGTIALQERETANPLR